jgi:hypothetical protein
MPVDWLAAAKVPIVRNVAGLLSVSWINRAQRLKQIYWFFQSNHPRRFAGRERTALPISGGIYAEIAAGGCRDIIVVLFCPRSRYWIIWQPGYPSDHRLALAIYLDRDWKTRTGIDTRIVQHDGRLCGILISYSQKEIGRVTVDRVDRSLCHYTSHRAVTAFVKRPLYKVVKIAARIHSGNAGKVCGVCLERKAVENYQTINALKRRRRPRSRPRNSANPDVAH